MPVWLVVFLVLFGSIGLLDRIIGPGVRWFFRRKANQAIDEINTRLHLRIQPFKMTRRQTLIDQLMLDPEVVKAIEAHVTETGVPRDVALAKAERYAKEIVPAFNAYAYLRIGTRLARWASKFIYRVRLGYHDDEAIAAIDPEVTVVFVMNHRSNMDYVLVTYLVSASAILSYAVGEWARVWLLQNLIRAMGAYFIRRESGNVLYRRVLARYVAMATHSGVTQAIFPEGGLSRNGLLREPRFGLLGYMIGDFDAEQHRDVVFVPVGLNYDRVLEDRVLISAAHNPAGAARFQVSFWSACHFVGRMINLRFQKRLYRYGYACAGFGLPISLKTWCQANKIEFSSASSQQVFEGVERLGHDLMEKVGEVVPVLPVALLSILFEQIGETGLTEIELKSRAFDLVNELRASGAHIHVPHSDMDYAITTGLRMLILRHAVVLQDGVYRVGDGQRDLITFYANSIRHLHYK